MSRLLMMALATLLLASPGARVGAQLSLSPEIGFYIPTEKLVDAANGTVGELEAGPSFGLRLALGLGSRVRLSVGGSYVPTTFALQPGGGPAVQRDARLFTGAAQLMLFLIPPTSPLSVFINGGVGAVSRGGVAFTDDAETTDLSGIFGGGAQLNLGGISLLAGADVFSYTAQYTGTQAVASELKQLDVQVRLGLGFGLGGSMGMRR